MTESLPVVDCRAGAAEATGAALVFALALAYTRSQESSSANARKRRRGLGCVSSLTLPFFLAPAPFLPMKVCATTSSTPCSCWYFSGGGERGAATAELALEAGLRGVEGGKREPLLSCCGEAGGEQGGVENVGGPRALDEGAPNEDVEGGRADEERGGAVKE